MQMSAKSQDAMVTGRMSADKKAAGNKVLEELGLNPSQAINMLYDRLIADGDAAFLGFERPAPTAEQIVDTWNFVRGLALPRFTRFDGMTNADIALERARAKGVV